MAVIRPPIPQWQLLYHGQCMLYYRGVRLILEIHWYRKIGSWLLALNKIYDREGLVQGMGVTVSSRETFPNLRLYTVKVMLATFGSTQSHQNYTGGQITETTWDYEN